MSISGLDHVTLPTNNPVALMEFYGALGFNIPEAHLWRNIQNPRLVISCGNQKINLLEPAEWQNEQFTLRGLKAIPGCGDLCFVWDGTLEELSAAFQQAGATPIAGPVERFGGRDHGQAKGMSVYIRDPDENLIEFILYER